MSTFAFTVPLFRTLRTSPVGSSGSAPSIVTFAGAPATYAIDRVASVSVTGIEGPAAGATDTTRKPIDALGEGATKFAATMKSVGAESVALRTKVASGENGSVAFRTSDPSSWPLPFV